MLCKFLDICLILFHRNWPITRRCTFQFRPTPTPYIRRSIHHHLPATPTRQYVARERRSADLCAARTVPTVYCNRSRCCILVGLEGVHMGVEGDNADPTIREEVRRSQRVR